MLPRSLVHRPTAVTARMARVPQVQSAALLEFTPFLETASGYSVRWGMSAWAISGCLETILLGTSPSRAFYGIGLDFIKFAL